jgi:hypothetical protein
MTEPGASAIDLVCTAMRGAPGSGRPPIDPADCSRFLDAAVSHRVRPLLAWALRQAGALDSWPADVRRALTDAERAEAALEVVRRQQLCGVVRAFDAANVPVLLIKGAALAYSIYPEPWLRPREDTDLLVDPADVDRADQALAASGYRAAVRQSGRFVSHQRLYVRAEAHGRRDAFDLHWKIANPAAFADLLSAGDLLRDSATIAIDRAVVRIPSTAHSLLLACWHRVSHHADREDLLWLYDVHLLTSRRTAADAAVVIDIARRTGTGAICARGVRLAAERFASGPAPLAAELDRADGPTPSAAAAYLARDARPVDLLTADLKALPDWGSRARLLKEHLFPPAAYMHETYGRSSMLLLPALYAWRIASGARRWLQRPRDPVA